MKRTDSPFRRSWAVCLCAPAVMMSYRGLCHRMPFRIMLTSIDNRKVIEGNDKIMGDIDV